MKTFITLIAIALCIPPYIAANGCYDYFQNKQSPFALGLMAIGKGELESNIWSVGVKICSKLDDDEIYQNKLNDLGRLSSHLKAR